MIEWRMPHKPGGRLAEAYNACIAGARTPWVGLVESDVLLVNRNFDGICRRLIAAAPPGLGAITCVTNRCKNRWQCVPGMEDEDSLAKHLAFARRRYEEFGDSLLDYTDSRQLMSGFFMLIRVAAWEDIEPGGQFGRDNLVHKRMAERGWRVALARGLYVLHLHKRDGDGSMLPEEKTIVELYREHQQCKP